MTLQVTDDEALVLFELLSSYPGQGDGRALVVNHAAERNALVALHAVLEQVLAVPFQKDYEQQLAAARARVEESGGSWDSWE